MSSLPPLPEPDWMDEMCCYTTPVLIAYADEAVRLEREAIIALIDDEMIITDPSDRAEAAAAIRARSRAEG
jgi:hypothetical protein